MQWYVLCSQCCLPTHDDWHNKHPSKHFISTGPNKNSTFGNQCHNWPSNIQFLLTAARKTGKWKKEYWKWRVKTDDTYYKVFWLPHHSKVASIFSKKMNASFFRIGNCGGRKFIHILTVHTTLIWCYVQMTLQYIWTTV